MGVYIMQLCSDIDLAILEPGVFLEPGLAHLKLVRGASASVAGTGMSTIPNGLANVAAGMIASLGSPGQLVEITQVVSTSSAVISVIRTSSTGSAIPPGLSGSMELSVISFKPVIEYASEELMDLLGVAEVATDRQVLLRQATVCRTLSLLYMALVQGIAPTSASATNTGNEMRNNLWKSKSESYRQQWESLRRKLSLRVDRDGDGVPETMVRGDVAELRRV